MLIQCMSLSVINILDVLKHMWWISNSVLARISKSLCCRDVKVWVNFHKLWLYFSKTERPYFSSCLRVFNDCQTENSNMSYCWSFNVMVCISISFLYRQCKCDIIEMFLFSNLFYSTSKNVWCWFLKVIFHHVRQWAPVWKCKTFYVSWKKFTTTRVFVNWTNGDSIGQISTKY